MRRARKRCTNNCINIHFFLDIHRYIAYIYTYYFGRGGPHVRDSRRHRHLGRDAEGIGFHRGDKDTAREGERSRRGIRRLRDIPPVRPVLRAAHRVQQRTVREGGRRVHQGSPLREDRRRHADEGREDHHLAPPPEALLRVSRTEQRGPEAHEPRRLHGPPGAGDDQRLHEEVRLRLQQDRSRRLRDVLREEHGGVQGRGVPRGDRGVFPHRQDAGVGLDRAQPFPHQHAELVGGRPPLLAPRVVGGAQRRDHLLRGE
jgi:hypothetical protein